ncbi:GntR family transcriptional regulator [Microbacterium alcoholitolerans]|uniref:GntR family transcriptional regulator n=1 Tax=unclassified Microbacterium TaxID=2609290 RepID=UPI003D178190
MAIERTTMLESVRVADALRNDIMLGRRLPGSRLVERDIAAELRVSRLPVREAIRVLVAEGVVVARPRTWAVVREFSAQDLQDFAEVREAMETLAFALATARIDDDGIAQLQSLVRREAEAAENGDADAARNAAAMFHLSAVRLSGNAMLVELGEMLVTRLRWLFGQHDDLGHMAGAHHEILDAMRARDVARVQRLIPAHLAEGRLAAEQRLEAGVENLD